jgi:hypothetical protein
MSVSAVRPQPPREEGKAATRSSKADTKSSVTIERLFEQCIGDINEAAWRTPEPTTSQLSSIARKVDDSYFRLQIWGSDLGGDSTHKITFTDILGFKDSPISETIHEILENFKETFGFVGAILIELLEGTGKM